MNSRYFVSRKNCFALLCIAVCDAHRRFTFFSFSTNPNTHDSLAWTDSYLGSRVEAGELPPGYFINGDAAFNAGPSMVVPTGKREHATFDHIQSAVRMPIECSFGILIRRWGILWRPLEMRFNMRAQTIGACMRLHNFCIDKRIGLGPTSFVQDGHGRSEIQPSVWMQTPAMGEGDRMPGNMANDAPRGNIHRGTTQHHSELIQSVEACPQCQRLAKRRR